MVTCVAVAEEASLKSELLSAGESATNHREWEGDWRTQSNGAAVIDAADGFVVGSPIGRFMAFSLRDAQGGETVCFNTTSGGDRGRDRGSQVEGNVVVVSYGTNVTWIATKPGKASATKSIAPSLRFGDCVVLVPRPSHSGDPPTAELTLDAASLPTGGKIKTTWTPTTTILLKEEGEEVEEEATREYQVTSLACKVEDARAAACSVMGGSSTVHTDSMHRNKAAKDSTPSGMSEGGYFFLCLVLRWCTLTLSFFIFFSSVLFFSTCVFSQCSEGFDLWILEASEVCFSIVVGAFVRFDRSAAADSLRWWWWRHIAAPFKFKNR